MALELDKEFTELCDNTVAELERRSRLDPDFFPGRTPTEFEKDVHGALERAARGTSFEGRVSLKGGHRFPDIVVGDEFGVEVKATASGKWTSTGNSVLESTRVKGVERIHIIFGQLIKPARFKWRLYEECLHEVAVTHSPRYLIDMELPMGASIFDKMGCDYDGVRRDRNPIALIVEHYRRKAKPGEEPWWMGQAEQTSPMLVKHWGDLPKETRNELAAEAMARFPELLSSSSTKYKRLASWLAARHGVVSPSLRDSFSAGGKVTIEVEGTAWRGLPRVFENLRSNLPEVLEKVRSLDPGEASEYWAVPRGSLLSGESRVGAWSSLVSKSAATILKGKEGFMGALLRSGIQVSDASGH